MITRACLLVGLLAVSCIATAQNAGEEPAITPRGPIMFIDSKLFDGKLSSELESGKSRVEVDVTSKVTLSSIPGRMDKWLSAAAEEGKVEFRQVESVPQRTRFLFGVLPLVFSFLQKRDEEKTYKPVKDYDVAVLYRKNESGDALIEKIVFTRKN